MNRAGSNDTKKALATALRDRMSEVPFSKVTVGDICDKCGMNRKSFYYHFKDKYDLVNWIFDTEFRAVVSNIDYDNPKDFLYDMCAYLYENRDFYRRALMIDGQNSFSEHFREVMRPLIADYLKRIMPGENIREFHITFFTDAFMGSIERWIMEKDCMPPDELIELLDSTMRIVAIQYTTGFLRKEDE